MTKNIKWTNIIIHKQYYHKIILLINNQLIIMNNNKIQYLMNNIFMELFYQSGALSRHP